MDSLKKDLAKAHYYSVLCDGSTDKSVIEQEAIFILFLSDGFPALRYLSIESVDNATATGVLSSLTTAFEIFGVLSFEKSLLGLNCDGASVNLGQFGGLGALIKEKAPWLELVHCFNHRIELALKDASENSAFAKIETMLMKLYYLYQKSPKRYRELKELSEAYEKLSPNQQKPMVLVGSTTNIEQWKEFLTITGLTLHTWRVSVIPILKPLKERSW